MFLYIVIDLHVAVKNVQLLIAVMKVQDCVNVAWLLSYKTFHTAVNNINILRSPCKCLPDIVVRF